MCTEVKYVELIKHLGFYVHVEVTMEVDCLVQCDAM